MSMVSKEIKALVKLLNEHGYRVGSVSQIFWTDEINAGAITLSVHKDGPIMKESQK